MPPTTRVLLAGDHGDPFVARDGDRWVLLHTAGRGVPALVSTAGLDGPWTPAGLALEPAGAPWSWARRGFWAPEVARDADGRWTMWVSAEGDPGGALTARAVRALGIAGPRRLGIARADDLAGPYVPSRWPVVRRAWAIDAHPATFPDGSRWLFTTRRAGRRSWVVVSALDDRGHPDRGTAVVVEPTEPWESYADDRFATCEAPWVEVRPADGAVVLLYSAANFRDATYALGAAELRAGADPRDPGAWRKWPAPVLRSGPAMTSAGHCCVVEDADGTRTVVLHGRRPAPGGTAPRCVVGAPLRWTAEGRPQVGDGEELVPEDSGST